MMIVKLTYLSILLSLVKCQNDIFGIPSNAFKSAPEMIASFGYNNEIHHVQTDDGYIITMFRIGAPNNVGKAKRKPVLMTHGFGESSVDFVIQGPGKSLALLLADRNYDVWIMNCRGTMYSLNHTSIPISDSKFWNYSLNEIGMYDIPSCIDHILKLTGFSKLIHVGYSQGTTSFYAMLSLKPQFNVKIQLHVSLAPAAFFCKNGNELVKTLILPEKLGLYSLFLDKIGHFNLLPHVKFLPLVIRVFCIVNNKINPICLDVINSLISGHITSDMASELMVFFGGFPAGVSTKCFMHFAQLLNNCGFRKYKVGYGVGDPYTLENVKVPIHAYYGTEDTLTTPADVLDLALALNTTKVFTSVPNFGHFDFINNREAANLVYYPIIKVFDSYE